MIVFDIILAVILLWAVYDGFRDGIVVQLGGIASLFVGAYLAFRFGRMLGALLGICEEYAGVVGFLIVFVGVIVLIALLSRLLRSMFKAVGAGILDKVGGVVLSAVKVWLVLALILYSFDAINRHAGFVQQQTLDKSRLYNPLIKTAGLAFPYIDFVKDKLIGD